LRIPSFEGMRRRLLLINFILFNRECFLVSAMSSAEKLESRSCPRCLGAMVLMRIIPKHVAYPELRTFQCLDCGHVMTLEVDE
jgi:hypothetical protein